MELTLIENLMDIIMATVMVTAMVTDRDTVITKIAPERKEKNLFSAGLLLNPI